MPTYLLPEYWSEYLIKQPETGMGYQRVDLHFSHQVYNDLIICGAQTVEIPEKDLDLSEIEQIIVKQNS